MCINKQCTAVSKNLNVSKARRNRIRKEKVALGSMDPDIIRKTLTKVLPSSRTCISGRFRNVKEMKSRINFKIKADGRVSEESIHFFYPFIDLLEPVKTCVLKSVRGLRFPRPLGGGYVRVSQPVHFQLAE